MAGRDPGVAKGKALPAHGAKGPGSGASAVWGTGLAVTGPREGDWVTLRYASEITQVPVSTLRGWYTRGKVDSRLAPGPHGKQRFVRLGEVMSRAWNIPELNAEELFDGALAAAFLGVDVTLLQTRRAIDALERGTGP
jgi:hypothetical protein